MSTMKPSSGLVAKIETLQEQARLRSAREERDPTPDAVISNNVVKLPLWPEAVRAVPNSFLRSALFGAIRKGRRRYIDGERLAAIDGIEVHYTGQRLDQGDLDVWESLLHAVRDQNLGSQCQVTSYALLKLMGKADTGGNRATLHKRITRLRASAIEIKQGRYVYIGGLVDEAYKDEETQEWVIVLNPRLRALYGADQFTQVDWVVRHALNGQQLAQWLHGFYASHAKPFPVRIETLLKLAGSENENSRSAQQKLRKALNAVAEAIQPTVLGSATPSKAISCMSRRRPAECNVGTWPRRLANPSPDTVAADAISTGKIEKNLLFSFAYSSSEICLILS